MFIGRTDAEAETLILWPPDVKSWFIWKDPDAGKNWGQEEKGTIEDEMVGWHHWLDGHEFEWTLGVGDGQGGLVCCGSWGCKESDTTDRLNCTELTHPHHLLSIPLLSGTTRYSGLFCTFSAPTLESFFQEALISFIGEWHIENKKASCAHCYWRLVVSRNLWEDTRNYTHTYVHTPHHIYFYNHPSGYIKSHEIILNPSILVQHHRVHSSLPLLSLFAIPFFSTEIPGSLTTIIYSFAWP